MWLVQLSARRASVAIPLGQGQVFNGYADAEAIDHDVAIPLGQGQVFNFDPDIPTQAAKSQSLWVRDRFLIIDCALHR